MNPGKTKKISGERLLLGRLISVDVDQVLEPGATKPARREVVRHPGAVAVVPLSADGKVVLVHQYRYATDSYHWEIPAGILEKGEAPIEAARRELAEETGYRAESVSLIASLHSSPGFSDEVIHLFRADSLRHGEACPDPEERLEVREFGLAEALEMVTEGLITDGKTVCGLLLAGRDICPLAGPEM